VRVASLSLPQKRHGERGYALRYGLAFALERTGRYEEAIIEYKRVARLHHASSFYQNSATFQIISVLFKLERYEEVLEWIGAYRASGRIYYDREDMAYKKGLALFHLGRKEEAIRVLQELAAGKDDQHCVPQARRALAEIDSGSLRPRCSHPEA
jgi:tetratricopeptide (TPR) repeat protein